MPDYSRASVALLAMIVGAPLGWAQPAPSLKQLLELDTQAAQEKKPAVPPRPRPSVVRPELLAIYGPSGQRTVLVRLGAARVLFQESHAASLPTSPYQLLGIEHHCASFRRAGSKTRFQACLSPIADPLLQPVPQRASRAAMTPPTLPWPVKETP